MDVLCSKLKELDPSFRLCDDEAIRNYPSRNFPHKMQEGSIYIKLFGLSPTSVVIRVKVWRGPANWDCTDCRSIDEVVTTVSRLIEDYEICL